MISSKIRVKVQSVEAINDPDAGEVYKIDFVEIRTLPPMMVVSNPEVPEELNQMVIQVTKSFQGLVPGMSSGNYERHRMTVILTGEELESFGLKPYPNQFYVLTIAGKGLVFEEVSP